MFRTLTLICAAGALALTACSRDRDLPLPGERLDLREQEQVLTPDEAPSLRLPALSTVSNWTHRNGGAAHYAAHPNLSQNAQLILNADIGKGNQNRERLAADPIIGDGRLYTMDTESSVRAYSMAGALLWQAEVKPLVRTRRGRSNDGSGGGLAFSGGQLAVTTPGGEVLLLNAATGTVIWRHDAEASFSAPPAFAGDRIIAISGDNRARALTRSNGRIAWSQDSDDAGTAVLGTAAPAIAGNIAIIPFNRGEVKAVDINTGIARWSQVLTGKRVGIARGNISAITTDPVIVGQIVYVGTQAGRIAAINLATGERIWTAREGAVGPIWPAGNALFVLGDEGSVQRLNTSDGRVVWETPLPQYRNERRFRGNYGHYGPTLAGGLLYVGGTDGIIRVFRPEDGTLVRTIEIRGGVSSQAAVVNNRMYLFTGNGQLAAFQ
ncbi:MAG: PQQ-binding-like beta-propeller repeat protein [Pseudomonadota bacterium]